MGYELTPKVYTFEETCERIRKEQENRLAAFPQPFQSMIRKQLKELEDEYKKNEAGEQQLARDMCALLSTCFGLGYEPLEIINKYIDKPNEPKH